VEFGALVSLANAKLSVDAATTINMAVLATAAKCNSFFLSA
jgi:hypothetical protein